MTRTSRWRGLLLALVAAAGGGVLAWVVLLLSFWLPGADRTPLAWFLPPLAAGGAATWLVQQRSRWLALALLTGVVVTLVFFGWLFWTLGQGMQEFD